MHGRSCYHSHESTSGLASFNLLAGEVVIVVLHSGHVNLMLFRFWKLEIRIINEKEGGLGISLEV
jgi:hypothetical protein